MCDRCRGLQGVGGASSYEINKSWFSSTLFALLRCNTSLTDIHTTYLLVGINIHVF